MSLHEVDNAPLLDQLLVRSAAGDEAAFAEVYDRTVGLTWPIILQGIGRIEDAEAVTRGVYTELWQQAPQLVNDGYDCAWSTILAITRRIVADSISLTRAGDRASERHSVTVA